MTVVSSLPVRVGKDINSRKAAQRIKFRVGSMRVEMLRSIYRAPNYWTCERFDIKKGWLHQSTSAQLNSLWRAGLIERSAGNVSVTRQGMDEYIYELPVWLRRQWDGSPHSLEYVVQRNLHRLRLA